MRCRSVTFAWPWDGCGGGCLSAVARKPVYPGLRWSAEWLAGSRKLTFVILIPGSALALLPKARAGCKIDRLVFIVRNFTAIAIKVALTWPPARCVPFGNDA